MVVADHHLQQVSQEQRAQLPLQDARLLHQEPLQGHPALHPTVCGSGGGGAAGQRHERRVVYRGDARRVLPDRV